MGYWGANEISSFANQNWTRNNKFWVEPTFEKGAKLEAIIRPAISDLKSFNACIIDINLYDSVADPIEQYINEEYVIAPGRIGSLQVSIKFRDRNQNELYKLFHKAMHDLKREYPEDISTTFNIYSEPSWNEKSSKLLLTAPDSIITAVSGLTLDSASQNQITEFTVTWRCPRFFTD